MFSIKMMLNKILTSFCCRITVSVRVIEIQNFHFDVTGRPYWEITYTSMAGLQCHAIKNKNHNHTMNLARNLGCDR